jgi:hypothetical protein
VQHAPSAREHLERRLRRAIVTEKDHVVIGGAAAKPGMLPALVPAVRRHSAMRSPLAATVASTPAASGRACAADTDSE